MVAGQFISLMFELRNLAHLEHLKTGSFAAHKALNDFYDGIIPLVDAYAESYLGRHGQISDFPAAKLNRSLDVLQLLKNSREWIDANRSNLGETTDLQNDVDAILSIINGTIYKLTQLK